MRIFIIGPGGVGKTTCGKVLARNIRYKFLDLDLEFCDKIENVGSYIKKHGYIKYCKKNSELFYELLSGLPENAVFVLSSGFLIYNVLGEKHQCALKKEGVSILLLPSKSLEESADIIVKRQLNRGFGLHEEKERTKFINRYPKYKKHGDIQIFSHDKPEKIVDMMVLKLEKTKKRK